MPLVGVHAASELLDDVVNLFAVVVQLYVVATKWRAPQNRHVKS